jgi:flavin-dependent dehydrogenase
VAIVGGGPAGAVAALVLARRGVPVTVIEARASPAAKVGETLPPSLAPLLRTLGLDAGLECDLQAGHHLRSQGNRSCWGSPQAVESPFLAHPEGAGWHIDRRRFESRLAAAAVQAGAEWRWGCRAVVSRAPEGSRRWQLALEAAARGREILAADFVADATGRRSSVVRRLGVRRLRYDRLVGLAAVLSAPAGRPAPAPAGSGRAPLEREPVAGAAPAPLQDTYTLVEATPDGWWYSALLGDSRLAVTLLSDGDLLGRPLLDRGGNQAAWWRRLRQTRATRERVEALGADDADDAEAAPHLLQAMPAESSRLDAIAGEGWLALGDAAAAYDPLSSHGVASALGSGFYGANAIADLLAGRTEARSAYLDVMQRAYGAYLDILRERYAAERRWPDAPFWRRRHAADYALEPL